MLSPHHSLSHATPDTVAEYWQTAVSSDVYNALWNVMDRLAPPGTETDLDDEDVSDAGGLHTVSDVWELFTPGQQAELNRAAVLEYGSWGDCGSRWAEDLT